MSSSEGATTAAKPSPQTSERGQAPSSFTISLGAPKAKPSSLTHRPLKHLNGHKRPHSSLHGSDDEGDAEEKETQARLVSGFDHAAGGAIGVEGLQPDSTPLVIAPLRNRDWREESRRRRVQRPPAEQAQKAATNGNEAGVVNGTSQPYGLSFVRKETSSIKVSAVSGEGTSDGDVLGQKEEPEKEKTVDELALEALASGTSARTSRLVLPLLDATEDNTTDNTSSRVVTGISEDGAFRADVLSRPDSASLADYAAVPVEEFGAALLRGMGWKEGDVVGKRKDIVNKVRVVERRPALLGIGAKELPGADIGEMELGAWGKAAAKKGGARRKVEAVYNPVMLRHSKTGEMLTEEELKEKVEEGERTKVEEQEDWRERRDRNLRLDWERKERYSGRNRPRSRSVKSTRCWP